MSLQISDMAGRLADNSQCKRRSLAPPECNVWGRKYPRTPCHDGHCSAAQATLNESNRIVADSCCSETPVNAIIPQSLQTCAALRVLWYRCMARQLRSRERVFLGCLFCSVLYLLTYHNLSLGFSVTWSNSAVRRVQKWDGHRNLNLLVVVPAVCGELAPASESRCLQHISKVCRDFATRSCNVKKGISQSDACDQALLHQKGSNDIKHS